MLIYLSTLQTRENLPSHSDENNQSHPVFCLISNSMQTGCSPPNQIGTLSSLHGVKQPEHEADHSPPCSTQVKNVWTYTSTLPMSSGCGA